MSTQNDPTLPGGWICPDCGGELVPTDEPGEYRCHRLRCDGEKTLETTDHVVRQYRFRTKDWRANPIEAFERGVLMDETHDFDGQEVRYDHESRTALIRNDSALMTAIDTTIARLQVKKAVVRTCVLELESPQATGEYCADAGISTEMFRTMTSDLRDDDGGARSGRTSGQPATRNSYSDQGASD